MVAILERKASEKLQNIKEKKCKCKEIAVSWCNICKLEHENHKTACFYFMDHAQYQL